MLRQILFMAMAFVLANTSFADHGIKAINGHTMELDGDVMIVQGVICPSLDTPEGMDAKRLANTYAHGRNVTCEAISNFGAAWHGDCKLNSNNGNNYPKRLSTLACVSQVKSQWTVVLFSVYLAGVIKLSKPKP